jgi:hypothetical protein
MRSRVLGFRIVALLVHASLSHRGKLLITSDGRLRAGMHVLLILLVVATESGRTEGVLGILHVSLGFPKPLKPIKEN